MCPSHISGHNRPTGRLSLDGDDAELLYIGHDHSGRSGIQIRQLGVADPAQELGMGY